MPRKYDFERNFEARMSRRLKAQDRYIERLERREAEAEKMIGELCRDGKPVYYICPQGGKYREGDQFELINFLIRNNYV